MNTRTKLILAVILILLPFGARFVWFKRGSYTPPEIAQDVDIVLPEVDRSPYEDEPARGSGTVVFDNAHLNNLAKNTCTRGRIFIEQSTPTDNNFRKFSR